MSLCDYSGYTCPQCGMHVPSGELHYCGVWQPQTIPAGVLVDLSKIEEKMDEIIKTLKEIRIDLVDVRIKR